MNRDADVYVDTILQNGAALEKAPLRGFHSDAWSGGWDIKNLTDDNLPEVAEREIYYLSKSMPSMQFSQRNRRSSSALPDS
jgi:hypothetical protein